MVGRPGRPGPARLAGVALGLAADRLVGEPPDTCHPLRAFGRAMTAVEGALWRDRRAWGTAHAGVGVSVGAGAGVVLTRLAGEGVGAALATAGAAGGRALADAARAVAGALGAGDLDGARGLLPALAGRDPSALDEKEVVRAVVESVAENTVDAVVAPALWAAAAGGAGALGYRAVNTLDAMVGHRSERYRRYGWASARLDDLAGWVPARVTAALVAAVRPSAAPAVWLAVRRDAPAHPSPNAGVAEAAFAAALDLRLGGTNTYGGVVDARPALGAGRPPEAADIGRAVALSGDVTAALGGLLLVGAVLGRERR